MIMFGNGDSYGSSAGVLGGLAGYGGQVPARPPWFLARPASQ